jgi:AAHS family 4-hydroxybenzoate transporter-like MFS transporter
VRRNSAVRSLAIDRQLLGGLQRRVIALYIPGSLLQVPLARRLGTRRLFPLEFWIFVILVMGLAHARASAVLTGSIAFLLGWTVQGAQAGLNAFRATFYPTLRRSTGLGRSLRIVRLGSLLGPLLDAWALQAAWSPRQIFMASSIPAVCAGLAVMIAVTQANSVASRPNLRASGINH